MALGRRNKFQYPTIKEEKVENNDSILLFNHHHTTTTKKRSSQQQSNKWNTIKIIIGLLLLLSSLQNYLALSTTTFKTRIKTASKQTNNNDKDRLDEKDTNFVTTTTTTIKYNSIPNKFDAYGILETIDTILKEKKIHLTEKDHTFLIHAKNLQNEFSNRYGGETMARSILQLGTSILDEKEYNHYHKNNEMMDPFQDVPSSLIYTAKRMDRARKEQRSFQFAFAGYSVTTGRGNYFHQSYPFVMKNILSDTMTLLGISSIQVRNAAIGGIPSFPYGWCLTNFLGHNPDVISWDYAMNEPQGIPQGFEAYLRQMLSSSSSPPKLIVKDTHMAIQRKQILIEYWKRGLIRDPIVIHTDPATDPFLLKVEEQSRPIGFQEWRKYGAPPDAPGKARHHPAVKEHEFIAWLISMQFLASMELLFAFDLGIGLFSLQNKEEEEEETFNIRSSNQRNLPPPLTLNNSSNNTTTISKDTQLLLDSSQSKEIMSLMFGSQQQSKSNDTNSKNTFNNHWNMDPISCRTSFEPLLNGRLDDLILSGITHDSTDIMLPKGAMFYNHGWVKDLGAAEKKAKRKLRRYGGLGFIDSKIAYYGIFASGPLLLFLPYEQQQQQHQQENDENKKLLMTDSGTKKIRVGDLFHSIVVCEVNEKRGEGECNMQEDVVYTVAGIEVNANYITATGTSFLGKHICVLLPIPEDAMTTFKTEVINENSSQKEDYTTERNQTNVLGVTLQISVVNKAVTLSKGPCSISHVIWQNKVFKNSKGI